MHRVREKKEKTLSPVRDVVAFRATSVFFFIPSLPGSWNASDLRFFSSRPVNTLQVVRNVTEEG